MILYFWNEKVEKVELFLKKTQKTLKVKKKWLEGLATLNINKNVVFILSNR